MINIPISINFDILICQNSSMILDYPDWWLWRTRYEWPFRFLIIITWWIVTALKEMYASRMRRAVPWLLNMLWINLQLPRNIAVGEISNDRAHCRHHHRLVKSRDVDVSPGCAASVAILHLDVTESTLNGMFQYISLLETCEIKWDA